MVRFKKTLLFIAGAFIDFWDLSGHLLMFVFGVLYGHCIAYIHYEYAYLSDSLIPHLFLFMFFKIFIPIVLFGTIISLLIRVIQNLLANQLAKRRKKHDAVIAKQ